MTAPGAQSAQQARRPPAFDPCTALPRTCRYDLELMTGGPVWMERVFDSGDPPCILAVHRDPDRNHPRRFLASATNGRGEGSSARRATLSLAMAHARILYETYLT